MPIVKRRAVKKRKRGTTKVIMKACSCCACKRTKPKPPKKAAKKKRVSKKAVGKKTVKSKSRKRASTRGKSLNGLDGKVFRLSRLQKRLLPPAMQKAILERQRKMGKTVIE